MARIKYKDINFRGETLALIKQCNDIIAEYLDQGLTLTLRQLYYQFVSRDAFPKDRTWTQLSTGKWVRDPSGTPNAEPNYKWLGSVLNDGRLAGYIDWDAIEDRGRRPQAAPDWRSIENLVKDAVSQYRLPRWHGQENYVELWVEKDALAGVLWPIAKKYHVTLQVNRGYSSQSAMHEAARRIIDATGQVWFDDARTEAQRDMEPYVLYLGDHDPSGEDMVRDIRDRLRMFGVYLPYDENVRKVALTTEQVREFNPPPNPVKLSDARAGGYIRRHGHTCWEVDALPPNVLARIIDETFAGLVNVDKMNAVKAMEERDKKKLRSAVTNMPKTKYPWSSP